MKKVCHSRKPKRCTLLDHKLTEAWHFHGDAGIEVVVYTALSHSVLRIPAASLRRWSKVDAERLASRAKGEGG